jgi:hypothetical protein
MDSMLSNGVKSIVDLARNDLYKEAYSNAEAIHFLNRATGEIQTVLKTEPETHHTLDNIDSLIGFIETNAPENENPVIFIRPTEIICILDYAAFRVHRVKVPLVQSPILSYLSRISSTQFEPKEAIRSLKFNLKTATLTTDPIPALQTLKFETSSSATHDTKPLDEGVSKSLQSKVSGAATIPEEFSVQFEMYPAISAELETAGSVTVEIELHVDPSKGVLTFRPVPGSIDRAILMAQQDVQRTVFKKLIAADREPLSHLVFLGQP